MSVRERAKSAVLSIVLVVAAATLIYFAGIDSIYDSLMYAFPVGAVGIIRNVIVTRNVFNLNGFQSTSLVWRGGTILIATVVGGLVGVPLTILLRGWLSLDTGPAFVAAAFLGFLVAATVAPLTFFLLNRKSLTLAGHADST